jgi:hypothetical protein
VGSLVALLVVVGGFVAVVVWAKRTQRIRAERAATAELVVDGDGIRRTLGDGRYEEVHWDELVEVEVVTRALTPARKRLDPSPALFVLAGDGERGVVLTSEEAYEKGVQFRLQDLPGYDRRLVQDVLDGVVRGRFVCWRRSSLPS